MNKTIFHFKNYKSIFIYFFLLCSHTLYAATITCTATGGNWSDPASWQGNVAPQNTDTVIINIATMVMDIRDTISVLVMQSGQINASNRLYVSGSFYLYSGSVFGTDTIIVGGNASFLGPGPKGIGNPFKLQGGGIWTEGLLDFTIHPTLGGSNVAPIDEGGTIFIENDTFKIVSNQTLEFKTNKPKGFYGNGKSVLASFGNSIVQNLGLGLGVGGVDSFTLCKLYLEGGGGGGTNSHCLNGVKDAGEIGIDCGNTCPNCPSEEPNEDDTDDDPDTEGLTSGFELYNPGGFGATVGTSCSTNESSGNGAIPDTINFMIFIDENSKMVFNSSVYMGPTAQVRGFGTLKVNNSILELNQSVQDTNFTIRKLILNDGTVLKGNGNISSRTIHSLKSTIKGTQNLNVTRLALDNSFLSGTGHVVVDSQFIMKGTIGNTLDRTVDVKWNSKWQCPDVSFAINGKINVAENATLHVNMLSNEMRFRNGKGPVIDNKGLINYISNANGKLVTPTSGNYIWNDGVTAVGRVKLPVPGNMDDNSGGGPGGSGGSDPPDGDGDIEPGNGGTPGCDNTPVPPPIQEGCFKLAKAKIRVRKGAITFNSCFDQITSGGLMVAETGNVTLGPGSSSTGMNITHDNGGTMNIETCLNIKDIFLTGNNATLNMNADCMVDNVKLMAGNFGGNFPLTIDGDLIITGGNLLGTRDIIVNDTTMITTGSMRNVGNSTHHGLFVWNGGSLGNSGVTGTIQTKGEMLVTSAFGKFLLQKTLLLSGNTVWSQGNINAEYGATIIVDTNRILQIVDSP